MFEFFLLFSIFAIENVDIHIGKTEILVCVFLKFNIWHQSRSSTAILMDIPHM